ncbi:hypothetical protein Y032_0042g629 [Ancylostoma ceylanicum]|uniref:DDHD domain-containing protein n=1 Tax=Ancylostoma ceylanicum TaxID=53326 RepID=A0A016UH81_9BILA|nr:hypothetical protein Y032_0042g629 [Ancylostoma ceylanicum]
MHRRRGAVQQTGGGCRRQAFFRTTVQFSRVSHVAFRNAHTLSYRSSPRSLTPPPAGDAGSVEKPVKKGWFSSFTSAPKKNATAAPNPEPPVEVAKEAESELPLPDRLLGGGTRPPHRMDFQLQPALTDKSYWSVLKSHFSYWTNADLALFIANTLFGKPVCSSETNGDETQTASS